MKVHTLVLGSGPLGGTVAAKCAAAGQKVAIAESRVYGGTCALRGCNPKKVLVRAAELKDWCDRSRGSLLSRESSAEIDWGRLVEFEKEFTDSVPEKSRASLEKAGVVTLEGPTSFVSPKAVQCGETEVEAEHICIATGARPATLGIPGEDLAVTSDEFLGLPELPRDVLFIGAGYIAFEFGHVAARAGSSPVLVGRGDRALTGFDPDLVDRLVEHSGNVGIDVRTGSEVQGIERSGDGFRVTVARGGATDTIETRLVVHAAGRVPHLDGLELERGEVTVEKGGIAVDETLRSVSNPRVHAGGDCANRPIGNLTPTANEDARVIVQALTEDRPEAPEYGAVPTAVFSVPTLARVGLSESEARERGHDVEVRHEDWSKWGSMRKVSAGCAAFKILVDRKSDAILGAHLLGPDAGETINLFAVAMRAGMTASELKSVLIVFPTFAADVRAML